MTRQLIVLVVIPDWLVRHAITDTLAGFTDHVIHPCPDVMAAAAALKRFAPDLVIIDAHLANVRAGQLLLLEACSGRPDLPVLRLIDGIPEESAATGHSGLFDPVEFMGAVDGLLALGAPESVGPTPGNASPDDPVSATVLVIDDDVMIRDLLVTLVSEPGIRVITAADGPAGLAAAATEAPDLVILDQMMPRMAGMAVLEQLRADGNPVPVVMLSAHRTDQLTWRGWSAGMSVFLDKPFDIDTLSRWVERLLRDGAQ